MGQVRYMEKWGSWQATPAMTWGPEIVAAGSLRDIDNEAQTLSSSFIAFIFP